MLNHILNLLHGRIMKVCSFGNFKSRINDLKTVAETFKNFNRGFQNIFFYLTKSNSILRE